MGAVGEPTALMEMIEGCRRQEPASWDAFQRWFGRLADRTLRTFYNLAPLEREEAMENARETVAMEVLSERLRASTDGAFVCFSRTVLLNAARDAWRRHRPGQELSPEMPDTQPWPAATASTRVQLDCVERFIQAWKEEDRVLFMLKLEQVSSAAIQADLVRLFGTHVSVGAVDVRFHRLRSEVRKRCGGAGGDRP